MLAISGGLLISLVATSSPPLPRAQAERVFEAPVIDGRLDEETWSQAIPLIDFTQVEPDPGAAPSELTDVRILYDEEAIYFGIRCFDRSPSEIITTTKQRDSGLGADDRVSIVIDPLGGRRNGFVFEMNALGARQDALIENSDRSRTAWDGIWFGAATIDDEGWIAEVAIPVRTLSFDPDASSWSLNLSRTIRRRNETVRWASPSPDKPLISIGDAGYLDGLHDLVESAGIDVVPFGVASARRDHDTDMNQFDLDGGVDIFYKPIPTLTFSLTLNTDFAETEVDDRQVNLTRFPLFFPEKRDFFLQDSWIFTFGGINRNPLPFHSRRIGIGPSGEQKDILVGAKLTGRVGRVGLGLLDVQMKEDDVLGNKNLFVGRATVDVLEQSTVGAIFTAGDPSTTNDQSLGGLDFNYRNTRFGDGKVLEAHAWVQRSDSSGADGSDWSYGGKLEYPNDIVNWSMGYSEIDDDFTAALGFVPRRGIREYFGNYRYRWRPEDNGIRTIDASFRSFFITNLDDEVESGDFVLDLGMSSRDGDSVSAFAGYNREVILDPFEISDGVIIPTDDHRFLRYGIDGSTSSGRPVSVRASLEGGDFYTGRRLDYSAGISWRASSSFFIGADYLINEIDLPEGSFTTRIIRGRFNVYFTPDLTWSNFVQYDNNSETIGLNSRVRWIVQPGNEMYFVLNQSVAREEESYRVLDTQFTTKIGWTFRF